MLLKNISAARIGLIVGPAAFLLCLLFFHPEGLSAEANAILACTLWIAIWWISEAIPIPVTSLLPLVLFPLTGGLSIQDTAPAYGHHLVFLYIGGFIIAIAIERWNLHKRIALHIIHFIGTSMKGIVLGFMVATATLSMWISNTATAVMMLPIGMAIIKQLKDHPESRGDNFDQFSKALMLAIAYSASIGGIATLVGTPPNLVLAGVVEEIYGVKISFATWITFGLPLSVFLLFICWYYLVQFAYPLKKAAFPGGRAEIKGQLKLLGKFSYEEKVVALVFFGTALAWISRSFLPGIIEGILGAAVSGSFGQTLLAIVNRLDDTIIAIAGAVILFIISAKTKPDEKIMDWESAVKLPWGIILLFGGGLALAEGFKTSGLAEWIGSQMILLQGVRLILLIGILVAAVNFLTEITSNVATTSMILPILAPMALAIGVHPFALMVAATLAASCAFMLPVATPPNAVVFGSGYVRISDMVRTGFVLNLFSIVVVTLMVYFLLGLIWGIDLTVFPEDWR